MVISDSDDDPGEDTGEAEKGQSRGREEEDQEEEDEEEEDEEDEEEEEREDQGPSAGQCAWRTEKHGLNHKLLSLTFMFVHLYSLGVVVLSGSCSSFSTIKN